MNAEVRIDFQSCGNEMTKEWTPSWLGRRLTGSPEWRLLRNGFELSLTAAGQSHCINVEDETSYRVQRGYFWTDITLHPGQACEVQVDGLPNFQGARLISALAAERQIREDVAFLQCSHQAIGPAFKICFIISNVLTELGTLSMERYERFAQ